ncbi:MAG: endonuclease III domain-containing protein [Candidatus Omnitrophica bacterium]|nr:endonuclease III domain-containing protein [Candidatus Omnitrophota bacterium]
MFRVYRLYYIPTLQSGYTKTLNTIYDKLLEKYGPQYWWPAESLIEVAVGIILTQNTAWINVEKAIESLKQNKVLSLKKLDALAHQELARLIRPCGYYNVKAQRLKNFLDFFMKEYGGSFMKMKQEKTATIRKRLLSIKGVGKETADSILLYVLKKPVFVVDAYTKRILARHRLVRQSADYDEVQRLFHTHIKRSAKVFNEYHALIVKLGKEHCQKNAQCDRCPLEMMLKGGGSER